jgi:hypothetical protein
METEIELYETERNVFGGSENGIGMAFLQNRRRNRISIFLTNVEFPFYV